MKTMTSLIWRSMALILCALLTATGCSSAPKSLGLAVVGVNYTDYDYSMSVHDLRDTSNRVSSGELTPFSAGGQMCCFTLPPDWRPGMKVRVRSLKGVSENGVWVRDDVTEQDVELPRYARDELGVLWALQFPDGKVEVLNSSVGPEHPQWSGSVKGWPKPSLAYRTKIWKIHHDQAASSVKVFQEALIAIDADPLAEAQKSWKFDMRYSPGSTRGFTGPEDLAYQRAIRTRYTESLEAASGRLTRLKKEQPK